MNRQIALGLGDLLITKMLFDTYNLKDNLVINFYIIDSLRSPEESHKNYIRDILNILFKDNKITYINDKNVDIYSYLNDYTITSTSLISYFDRTPIYNFDYIIFHTKCRFDCYMNTFLNYDKQKLIHFFKTFKCKYKIILLGEREIINSNYEVKYHNIQTIYYDLLNLNYNNDVIDLTQLYILDNPDINKLKFDIRLIHNASCNFGIGYGGNFGMSIAFGKCHWFIGDLHNKYIDNIMSNNIDNILLDRNSDNYINLLNQHYGIEKKYYGQFNPPLDKILYEKYFKNHKNGIAIECGAFDGNMECTCKFFEESMNWNVINIEASPPIFKQLIQNRPKSFKNISSGLHSKKDILEFTHVLHPQLGENFGNGSFNHVESHKISLDNSGCTYAKYMVNVDRYDVIIDEIMINNYSHNKIDLFVLDVEGNELEVIKGMINSKYLPRIFCVEYPQSGLDNIINILTQFGYKLDDTYQNNAFFIQ